MPPSTKNLTLGDVIIRLKPWCVHVVVRNDCDKQVLPCFIISFDSTSVVPLLQESEHKLLIISFGSSSIELSIFVEEASIYSEVSTLVPAAASESIKNSLCDQHATMKQSL